MQTLSTIQTLLPDTGITAVSDQAGLIHLVVSTPSAQAVLCLQGAQLTHFQPQGGRPVLWCSPSAVYQAGKAIRGGVPVCWPWFGAHPADASLPSHGFARTSVWELESVRLSGDDVIIRLALQDSVHSRLLWPHRFLLVAELTLGTVLKVELTVHNRDISAFELSFALHSYFSVQDIGTTSVQGLEGIEFLDQVDGMRRKRQTGPIQVYAETDRIYLDVPDCCRIIDADRQINIRTSGCRSTVVWNPWADKAARLADMPDDGFRRMLCVESGNVADNSFTLAAGDHHRCWLEVSII